MKRKSIRISEEDVVVVKNNAVIIENPNWEPSTGEMVSVMWNIGKLKNTSFLFYDCQGSVDPILTEKEFLIREKNVRFPMIPPIGGVHKPTYSIPTSKEKMAFLSHLWNNGYEQCADSSKVFKIIPDWECLSEKADKKENMNPVEKFVFENEPAGEESEKFRKDLLNAIAYQMEKVMKYVKHKDI